MRIIVLGAGVVGVAGAWYLAQAGHEVTVLERRAGPGLETSFANGGQIEPLVAHDGALRVAHRDDFGASFVEKLRRN